MRIKTSELSRATLNYAVAVCEGQEIRCILALLNTIHVMGRDNYNPSSNWSIAGPIIERERIRIDPRESEFQANYWDDSIENFRTYYSSSLLVAAMRCYVASKLGDEVEIPDELIGV